MNAYFIENFGGETIGPIVGIALTIVLIALALWVIFALIRRFRSGLFVSGSGKGRQPRLAVTDAVPVDSHRRLILVRRDDVEHLILIGGPSDIVVESGIGKEQPIILQQQARQPVQTTQPQAVPQPAPPTQRPAVMAAKEAVADMERGRPVRVPDVQMPTQFSERRTEPAVLPQAAPPVSQVASPPVAPPVAVQPTAAPVVATAPAIQTRSSSELDLDKLLDELRPNPVQDR